MKILLTHGYFLGADEKEGAVMKPYPPLGILYISGYLYSKGVDHDVFDTTFSTRSKLEEYLAGQKPDVVAFYVNLMTKVEVLRIIKFIRQHKDLSNMKVVLGGPDIRYNIQNYLSHGADFLVVGEGEETFYELIKAFSGDISIEKVKGVAYRNADGKVIANEPRTHIRDLSQLSLPRREVVDIKQYMSVWKKHHGHNSVSISTQRGCPYTCRWCSTAVYGQSYRRRPPDLVADEMAMIRKQYDPDMIWFVDDVFTVSHKWLYSLQAELDKRNLKIPFECITRADRLNYDILKLLKEIGCARIWIGAESGSQRILDAMDRRVEAEQVRASINQAKILGIETGTFIMVGYPGETEKDILETVKHLKLAEPDQFTITLTYPIAGTQLYEEVASEISNAPPWHKSTDRDLEFKRTYNNRYYHFAIRHIVNEVNFSKNIKSYKASAIINKAKSLIALAGMRLEGYS